jgi:hypothetical protein
MLKRNQIRPRNQKQIGILYTRALYIRSCQAVSIPNTMPSYARVLPRLSKPPTSVGSDMLKCKKVIVKEKRETTKWETWFDCEFLLLNMFVLYVHA